MTICDWKKIIKPYLLIAPAVIGIQLFCIYPILSLIKLSFFNTNMLNPDKTVFVGIENYLKMFARPAFAKAMINTVIYAIFTVGLVIVLSLSFAVWLGRKPTRINGFSQVCVFFPHIVATVSISLIWMWMMEPRYGVLNTLLRGVDIPASQWLQSSDTALGSIIFISVWQSVGYYTLIFIAAIQSVPQEIYEAAELDNATKFSTFVWVILPIISPQIFFVLIILTISAFKVFELILVMTQGGPNNATTSIVYLIYTEVFNNFRWGYGAVAGVVLLVIVAVLSVFYFVALSKKVYYQ